MIPDDVLAAAMAKVPDRHLGFLGGWESALSRHEVRVILEAAVAAITDRLKAEVADELTEITAPMEDLEFLARAAYGAFLIAAGDRQMPMWDHLPAGDRADWRMVADGVRMASSLRADDTVANLRAALKEAAAEMDRRYALGAVAERKRISERARNMAAEHRDTAIRAKSTKAATAAGHYAAAVDAFADQIGDSG